MLKFIIVVPKFAQSDITMQARPSSFPFTISVYVNEVGWQVDTIMTRYKI